MFTALLIEGHYNYSVCLVCSLHLLITVSQSTNSFVFLDIACYLLCQAKLQKVTPGQCWKKERVCTRINPDVTVSGVGGSTRLVIRS